MSSFRHSRGEQRGDQEREGTNPKCRTQAARPGHDADGERCCGTESAPEVVGQAHSRGTERGGKKLGGDDAEACEVPGTEEGEKRTEHQERLNRVGARIGRDQRRS